MRLVAIALFVAVTASLSQGGQPSAQADTVLGQGAMSCGTWLDGTGEATRDPNQLGWTLGYVSAVASSGTSLRIGSPPRPVTESYVLGWMESYCKDNRSVTLGTATRELVARLKATK